MVGMTPVAWFGLSRRGRAAPEHRRGRGHAAAGRRTAPAHAAAAAASSSSGSSRPACCLSAPRASFLAAVAAYWFTLLLRQLVPPLIDAWLSAPDALARFARPSCPSSARRTQRGRSRAGPVLAGSPVPIPRVSRWRRRGCPCFRASRSWCGRCGQTRRPGGTDPLPRRGRSVQDRSAPTANRPIRHEGETPMRAEAAVVLYEVRKPLVVEDVELMEPGAGRSAGPVDGQRRLPQRSPRDDGDYPHPLPVVLRARGRRRGRADRRGRRDRQGRRPRLLELYPVVRALRLLHRRAAHHVRAARQAALVHAGRHRRASAAAARRCITSSRSSGYATHAVLPEESVIPIRKDAPLDVGLPGELRRARRGRAVFNRAEGAAGRERGGVGLRRRGAQYHPGGAHGGRREDHRGGRDGAEAGLGGGVRRHHRRGRVEGGPGGARSRHQRHGRGGLRRSRWWGRRRPSSRRCCATHRGGTSRGGGREPGGHAHLRGPARSSSSACSPGRPSAPATSAPTCRC